MNIERIQLKGQLAEAKSKFKHLDTEAAALILLIRATLNPFEEDTTKLDIEKAVVSTFEMNNAIFKTSDLKSKVFYRADEEWLDFVMANRQNIRFTYDYDVVMGAVANDNVYASLNLYEDGFLSKKELLEELMIWKYVDQICFHSERALSYIRFLKSEEVF